MAGEPDGAVLSLTAPSDGAHLVPQFLAAVPPDPLSDGPMKFRSEAGAYVVYSVGSDGRDDNGDLSSELMDTIKRGGGRRILRGKDVGIRVLGGDR